MHGSRLTTIIGAVAVLFAVSACLPETENFLSDAAAAKPDGRLIGSWSSTKEDETLIVSFRRRKDGQMDVDWTEFRKGKVLPKRSLRYRGWPTTIADRTYLNLRLVGEVDETAVPKSTLVSYGIAKDGGLVLAFLSGEKIKKAIKNGTLAGREDPVRVPYDGTVVTVGRLVITSPRGKLVAFLENGGHDRIFTKGEKLLRRDAKPAARSTN